MNKKEYLKLKDEAKVEYEAKIKALDTVWEMVHGKPPSANGHGTSSPSAWPHNISKRDAVREAIKSIPGDFNMHRVREALNSLHPAVSPEISDNALSAILSKLYELEEMELVRAKVGKAPAIYKNKVIEK